MGKKTYKTPEAHVWAEEKAKELNGHCGVKSLEKKGLLKEYKDKFGHSLSMSAMYSFINKAKRKIYGSMSRKSGGSTFKKSKFLLVLGEKINGFDDSEQIKDFINANLVVLRDVLIFEKKEINVDYKINIK